MAYTKLDAGLTDSTIWQAPDTTRIVWITLLAMADQNGYIGASMPGLAGRARVSLDACIEAVDTLLSPDPWSRTRDHDGRRIAEADGGWILLNHAKYRAMQSADDRRERSRIAMAALREKRKLETMKVNGDPVLTKLPQAEAEAEACKDIAPTALVASASPRQPACPVSEVVELYHAYCPSMPRVEVVNDSRKRAIGARWREVVTAEKMGRAEGLEWFAWFFKHAAKSEFLTGRTAGKSGRIWRADFDFLTTASKFPRVIEGAYHKESAT